MKLSFEVDVTFEIPTLRFVLERGRYTLDQPYRLSCYFDKGSRLYALALRCESLDGVGEAARLLALAASWTVEVLERWPRDDETGRIGGDMSELDKFLRSPLDKYRRRPLFMECEQGGIADLDEALSWKAFVEVPR